MSAQSTLVHITEDRVRQLLDWESVYEAVENSIIAVSKKQAIQTPRTFTKVLNTNNLLLCMPGYLKNVNGGGTLACKMVTAFPENEQLQPALSSILANIFLFDDKTGRLKSIIEATEITAWRTAAASVVATKHLHSQLPGRETKILSIIGAGTQGRIHAIAFYHFFKFVQIKIWNHRPHKAKKLVEELISLGLPAIFTDSAKECVKNSDVIVTATYAESPIIEYDWIKSNVHINAVGAGTNHHSEISEAIYKNSQIYVDHMESAKVELKGLEQDLKVALLAEVGQIINKESSLPDPKRITIFHSLGIAAEDAVVGQLIYDKYISEIS